MSIISADSARAHPLGQQTRIIFRSSLHWLMRAANFLGQHPHLDAHCHFWTIGATLAFRKPVLHKRCPLVGVHDDWHRCNMSNSNLNSVDRHDRLLLVTSESFSSSDFSPSSPFSVMSLFFFSSKDVLTEAAAAITPEANNLQRYHCRQRNNQLTG